MSARGISAVRRARNAVRVALLARRERRVPFWPLERIERLQRRRVREIVRHAWETVRFYRRAMEERGLSPADFAGAEDLARLPLLDPLEVRLERDAYGSDRPGPGDGLTMRTSGTTTNVRAVVRWDDRSILDRIAHLERDRAVIRALAGPVAERRQLILLSPESQSLTLRRWWDERIALAGRAARRSVVSAEIDFDEVGDRLEELRPGVVFSYGSYAEGFFRHLAATGREVPLPRVWVYGGDMMKAGTRRWVEREFGCLVYSTYQAIETGRIGFECERRDGFHLNVDLCHVRLVDEGGEPVPEGEPGEVVVSNLENRATVLLNYRLGDRAVLSSGRCPCGRTLPVLERLEGRVHEIVTLADGRKVHGTLLTALFLYELDDAVQDQIVHPGRGRIVWRVVPAPGADRDRIRRAVLRRAEEALGAENRVEVEFVPEIPRKGGKVSRVLLEEPTDG